MKLVSILAAQSVFFSLVSGVSFGQGDKKPLGTDSTTDYQPPTGEQPVYGKKYRPSLLQRDVVIELNGLRLIERGLGLEFEKSISDNVSVGADLQYRNATVFDERLVKATVESFAFAPKVRLYPLATMNGLFAGFKLAMGSYKSVIKATSESEKSIFSISPTVHVGYRFLADNGFTMALYAGGGFNLPRPEFKEDDIKSADRTSADALDARTKINDQYNLFKPDYGLTIGVAL